MSSSAVWLCPDRIFDGALREGMALCVEAGLATDLRPLSDLAPGAARQRISGLVTPGFLDLQVNGGGDVLLNTDPTAEAMRSIAATHRRFGTVGILPTVITDSPEILACAVEALVAMGAVVSIGHSDASAEEVRELLAVGACCFTHLFNAMSPMLSRAPGVTGACINSSADAGIICDGIHVADEMVALAIWARLVPDTTFLVSDAMSTVGDSDRFMLYGQEIRLVEGRLINAEGALAGAHVTMAESLARLVQVLGVAPEVALRMAVTTPARVIGRANLAGIRGRRLCDLLVLDGDWLVTGGLDHHMPALVA